MTRPALSVTTGTGAMAEARGTLLLSAFAVHVRCSLVLTPRERPARCDGLLYRGAEIVATVEARCRNRHARTDLRDDTYLITAEKLYQLAALSTALCVPCLLVVEMADRARYWWTVAEKDGAVCPHTTARLTTPVAQNDPRLIERVNAFLPFDAAKRW